MTTMKSAIMAIALLPIMLGISGTARAWWHDSVDYYYNHKIEALQKIKDCNVNAMNATAANSRQNAVLAAIVRMEQSSKRGVIPSDYGITEDECLDGIATVMRSSNDCWNAMTALRKP